MHPDLLNNSLFLRYYRQWQDDPTSVVFAPIAEYLLRYGLIDDALKVCREGLRHHPRFVSGRLVLAKVHLTRGNWEEAEEVVQAILEDEPRHDGARSLLVRITEARREEAREEDVGVWRTVTMAQILLAQGHRDRAHRIFESILQGEPHNDAARQGLRALADQPA